ncbi:acyl-CoA thioesterase [Candidatus Blastococcus massiliensis]|uniref:acyl-CoA thioesterase n=1 Tax=Candidatus Blastococcus massiliensis TaxID=1470358 RepID=UPI0004BC3583|nr:acyl-CoA thioesterase II [Candidatus Blastococcus massiliensis]
MEQDDAVPAPNPEVEEGIDGGLGTVLRVRPTGEDRFRAAPRRTTPERSFGGAVVAQALLAGAATVATERPVHSLHAYFLRVGEASAPTDFVVDRVRDGGSYSTRRVTAEQDDRAILELSASFSVPQTGFAHQVPVLDAPAPESLVTVEEVAVRTQGAVREWFDGFTRRHPFDVRFDGELPRVAAGRGEPADPRQRFWFRALEDLPEDPLVHAAALAYASDMLLLSTSLAPHARMVGGPGLAAASLDHAVWFHRPARVDEWLCYEQESSWADGSRALMHGRVFDRDGRLVMTVAQEGMVRVLGPR